MTKKLIALLLAIITIISASTTVFASDSENDIASDSENVLTHVPGDVNGDGSLSAEDARLVLRASVELEQLNEEQIKEGDTYKDGKITATDARLLLRGAVELEIIPVYEDRENMSPPPIKTELSIATSTSLIYSIDDKRILFANEIDKKIPTASTSKLLTAAVALTYCSPQDIVTIGDEVKLINEESSECGIKKNDVLTMYDLLTGLLIESGNDAAYSVAVYTAKKAFPEQNLTDEEALSAFCGLLNEKAEEIGLHNSHFSTPDGWDDENHYSTARDLLTLTKFALSIPEIKEITSIRSKDVTILSGKTFNWKNTNKLLRPDCEEYYMPEAVGIKTGMTDEAGWCTITSIAKNDRSYIIIALGCETQDDRYFVIKEMCNLLDGTEY